MKKNKIKRVFRIFMFLFLLLSLSKTQAQKESFDFHPHIRFGGGIGLSFGDGFFSGSLSPSAIYQFNQQFAMGLGLSGTYSSLKNRYNSTIIGASVISLYNVIPEIQLSAEFEESYITRKYKYIDGDFTDSYWNPALFLGVGFHSSNITIGIRYDVLFDRQKSIYAEAYAPFVRIYF